MKTWLVTAVTRESRTVNAENATEAAKQAIAHGLTGDTFIVYDHDLNAYQVTRTLIEEEQHGNATTAQEAP